MTDVTKLQQKVERGQQAEEILRNPAWIAAAEEVSKQLSKDFKSDDMDKAMQARNDARAVEKFLTKLVNWQSQGQRAFKEINDLQRRKAEGKSMDFNDIQGIA